MPRQVLQDLLEVAFDQNLHFGNIARAKRTHQVSEDTHSLHLVKCRIMGPIHRVFPVDITHDQEGIVFWMLENWNLVRGGMRAKAEVPVEVVGIGWPSAHVVRRDE